MSFNKIMSKEVDWSLFNAGLTVPKSHHDDFYKVLNKRLYPGDSIDIKLQVNGKLFDAKIRNIKFSVPQKSEVVQILYSKGLNPIQDEIIKLFTSSYEYIRFQRERLTSKKNIKLPPEISESIAIYETSNPLIFRLSKADNNPILLSENKSNLAKKNIDDIVKFYKESFCNLRCSFRNSKPAPHKAILLITLISLIRKEVIIYHQFIIDRYFIDEFNKQWNLLISNSSCYNNNICMPFFRMGSEKFWRIIGGNLDKPATSPSKLIEKNCMVEIDKELFMILKNPEYRIKLNDILIQNYILNCD